MYVVVVDIEIAAGAEEAFMAHMMQQAANSLDREPDCLQFDVCVAEDNPTSVLLYEIYTDRAAFDRHLASAHFAAFDAAVTPLMERKTARTFLKTDG